MIKIKIPTKIDRGKLIIHTILYLNIFLLFSFFISCENELTINPFYEGIYEGRNESISEYITAKEDTFSMFRDLMNTGSVYWTLTAYNPHGSNYTVFLPTNDAINNFIEVDERYGSFQDLLNDLPFVNILVRYHIVNKAIQKNDFPYGSLTDTTLSGDVLTIGFSGELGSTVLKVNNESSIIQYDIELTNGYIHIIDKVLNPVLFSHYEWLAKISNYSIFTAALIETGLSDNFKIKNQNNNEFTYPSNTLLVESNTVLGKKGIFSIDDLKNMYSPESQDYKDYSNGLYQFMSYHLIEGKKFLNDFEGVNTNYNTYASLPIRIDGTGLDLKLNSGVETFDTVFSGNDTIIINYVGINYEISNVTTKNGALHFVDNVLNLFKPNPIERIFQFLEDPVIASARQTPGNYTFDLEDLMEFKTIKWEGVEKLEYIYSSSTLTGIHGNDYLVIEGDFSITYEIPKMLPGSYNFLIRANDEYQNNATIQVFLDGKSMGGNIDLTSNPNKSSTVNNFPIGQVVFDDYEKHIIRIQTLIPGRFTWDAVYFTPI